MSVEVQERAGQPVARQRGNALARLVHWRGWRLPPLRTAPGPRLASVAVAAAATAPLLSTLNGYFLADDFGLIQLYSQKPPFHFLTLFTSAWTDTLYGVRPDELRPLLALSYQVDASWGAASPLAYHLTNIALHVLNSLLVMGIARRAAGLGWTGAGLAGALFAVLPSQAEVGAWISGRADSLPALFYLSTFLAYVAWRYRSALGDVIPSAARNPSRWEVRIPRPVRELGMTSGAWLYVGSLGAFFCALYTKQSAIMMLATLIAYDLIVARTPPRPLRRWLAPYIPYALLTAGYLALRYALFGNAVREALITPEALASLALVQATYLQMVALGSQELRLDGLSQAATLAALGLGLLAAAVRLIRPASSTPPVGDKGGGRLDSFLYFGPVWWIISVAPLAVTYVSTRHLYAASAGFAVALAIALTAAWQVRSRVWSYAAASCTVALLLLYGASLTRAVGEWNASAARSQRMAGEVRRAAEQAPAGALILLDVPASNAPIVKWRNRPALAFSHELAPPDRSYAAWTWLWSWAFPFVVQPPFASTDLTRRVGFVEPAGVHCCPSGQWHRRVRESLEAWAGRADGAPAIVLIWDPDRETIGRHTEAEVPWLRGALLELRAADSPDDLSGRLGAIITPLRR